jgi:hypothetical protein
VQRWKAATQRDRDLRFTGACPLHRNDQARWLRQTTPAEWADAVAFDRTIRGGHQGGVNNAKLRVLGASLYRSGRPLGEVDRSTPQEHGQLNLFEIDCRGGVGGR